MKMTLEQFLNSDLLYKYLVEETSAVETVEVEYFIENYPEAKEAYGKLQDDIYVKAQFDAVETPNDVLENVLKTIDLSEKPKVVHINQKIRTPWYSIAASVAAVLFAVASFVLYQRNQILNSENNVVVDEIFDLRSDIEKNNMKLDELSKQLTKLNNPDAKKYVISGNERAKDLKTVAYINPVDKTSLIDVITLPQLPEDQHYQIWAELQDRMVSLGILDKSDSDRDRLKQIPYLEDASALSITIESKERGASTPTNANEVAEISLQN